jgi:hypothetical protein
MLSRCRVLDLGLIHCLLVVLCPTARLMQYMQSLMACGVKLLVVLDGMQEEDKFSTTKERRQTQAKESESTLKTLTRFGCRGLELGLWSMTAPLLPLFAVETLAQVCTALSIECTVAEREADRLLAITAR